MVDGVRETRTPGEEYLRRYQTRMSRSRRLYAVIVTLIVAACVVGVVVAYQLGSISHVRRSLLGVAGPTPTLGSVTSGSSLTNRWSADERLAQGAPVYGDVVVTYGSDSVQAHNALTGKLVWTYARTDRTVCSVVQEQGKTVVLFRNGANCDELNTLVTSTGKDSWQRTVSTDSATVDGVPYSLPQTDGIDYVTSSAAVKVSVASQPCDSGSDCGVNYWSYAPPSGCSITGFAGGSAGALIALRCGDGYRLVLQNPSPPSDGSKPLLFTVQLSAPVVPLAAGNVLLVYVPGRHQVQSLSPTNGKVTQTAGVQFSSGLAHFRTDQEFTDQRPVVCDGTRCYVLGSSPLVAPFDTATGATTVQVDREDNSVYGIDSAGSLVQTTETGIQERSWTLTGRGYSSAYRVSNGFVVGGGARTAFVS